MTKFTAVLVYWFIDCPSWALGLPAWFGNIFNIELASFFLRKTYGRRRLCPNLQLSCYLPHIYLTSRRVCFENIFNSALVNISLNIYIYVCWRLWPNLQLSWFIDSMKCPTWALGLPAWFGNIFNIELAYFSWEKHTGAGGYAQIRSCPVIFHISIWRLYEIVVT